MTIRFKLSPIPDFNATLHLKRAWRVLLEDGSFELYETHVGEWTTSLQTHMRWPNQTDALTDTIRCRLPDSPVMAYLRCRAKSQSIVLTK
jgi:hypothetical protein